MKRLFYLLALPLFVLGLALAQTDAPVIAGVTVPDSVWYLAATVIGVFVTWIASPLTELLKGRFGFQGNVTQLVYLVVSTLFVVGYGLAIGAFGAGGHGWLSAGMALLTALIKGFGDYDKLKRTSAAGAAAVQLVGATHLIYPDPAPGLEPAHRLDGALRGYLKPLT